MQTSICCCEAYPFHHIFCVLDDHNVSGEHFFFENERRCQVLIRKQVNSEKIDGEKPNVNKSLIVRNMITRKILTLW
jgi:hypothetical protein